MVTARSNLATKGDVPRLPGAPCTLAHGDEPAMGLTSAAARHGSRAGRADPSARGHYSRGLLCLRPHE